MLARRFLKPWTLERIEDTAFNLVFVIPITLLFAYFLLVSLWWDSYLDPPMFLYTGFLMEKFNAVPVRDFFSYNMAGTHVIFHWLYVLVGSSDLGMRLVDMTVLAVVLGLMAAILRPLGFRAAWTGPVVFGLYYMVMYEVSFLQRETFALVPLLLAVLIALRGSESRKAWRWFLCGLLCGSMITLKPHLYLCAPVFFLYFLCEGEACAVLKDVRCWVRKGLPIAGYFALGTAVPVLWMLGYYYYYGVLGEFLEIAYRFFPLHAAIGSDVNSAVRIIAPEDMPLHKVNKFFLHLTREFVHITLAALLGLAQLILFPDPENRPEQKLFRLLPGMLAVYALYPAMSCMFYDHNYIPFFALACLALPLCLRKTQTAFSRKHRTFSLLLLSLLLTGMFYVNPILLRRVHTDPVAESAANVRRISIWLKSHLKPGDTVQPIEWASCGIVHAMLIAEAKIATPIIWGEALYHHVTNPFVVRLRENFMARMNEAKPRYVIQSDKDYYLPGPDSAESFIELDALLRDQYTKVLESKSFTIWERTATP